MLVVRVEFRAGARTVPTPSARPAVAELLATQCFNFAHLGASALDAVADVARRAPGVHLVFGDLGDAAETIEQLAA